MEKTAQLYRMVMEKHICPFGIKAKYLLEKNGYMVEDHHLKTREETDRFKDKHSVETTPQAFINGERVGGYTDLLKYFGKAKNETANKKTYKPIIAVFSVTSLLAISLVYFSSGKFQLIRSLELFIALSMCVLAILKLRDLESFTNQFLGYDLLAKRWVPYAYIYPFAEAGAGILMAGKQLTFISAPVAMFIGLIGGISVFYAVYIQKRDLKCACVGGNSNVPLGFISLTENIMMAGMAIWMMI